MKLYLDRIPGGIEQMFPELGRIDEVTILNDGFRSLVARTPHGEVFKIAKNWEGGAGYAKEFQLLPRIRNRLPVSIPYPVWYAGPSRHFPFGAIGYPELPGKLCAVPDVNSTMARDLADFLLALHGTDLSPEIIGCVPQPRAYWDEIERLHNTLAPAMRELFVPDQYRIISNWWKSFLADSRMHEYQPVLHHGNFWHENLLVDPVSGRLCGVVDFENAAVGDPAQDFSTLMHLGRQFMLDILKGYRTAGGILDEDLLYRVQRLWELREFIGIGFAIRGTDQKEFEIAVEKLRSGPLLNESTRRDTIVWPPQQH